MEEKNPILIFLLFLLLIGGCAGPSSKTPSSPEESGYLPRKVYFLEFDQAWDVALKSLGKHGLAVGLQDKNLGIIRTDYQAGPQTSLWGKIYDSRYKYNIFFFKPGPRRTIMNIRCVYEIKEKEGKNYAEAPPLLTEEIIAREKKLYEIIESSLLAAEDSE